MSNLLLLAPPASGKGTQAEKLEKKYGIKQISTGNLLRKASKNNDDLGRKITDTLKSGKLVDDEVVISLLREELLKLGNQPFLLDGFPRTINQAEELELLLKEIGTSLDYVFLLEVPKEVLEKRIINRRICSDCGKVYNIADSNNLNSCTTCGGLLITRSDDTVDAYQVRYMAYLNSTYPLIEYYDKKKLLYRIDAARSVEEVFESISTILNRGDEK